ncbi:uncharacterized protein PB18E9.04c-like [Haliotis rufescens]|uniref:uncharacterized protein PB18E9.04c-like n=1 Tax=Haliotis rufescens TaxID=6454 RepID=UPI00201E8572|nr:uncharacterized protein PB18E9.04c-like [Haliotis rufescens]
MKASCCVLTLALLVSLTTSAPTQPPPHSGGATVVSMATSTFTPSGTFTTTPSSAPTTPSITSTSGVGASVSRSYTSSPGTIVPDTSAPSEQAVSPSGANTVEPTVSFVDSTSSSGPPATSSLSGTSGVNADSTSVPMTTTTHPLITGSSLAHTQASTTEINAAGDYVPFFIPVEIELIANENTLDGKSKTVL